MAAALTAAGAGIPEAEALERELKAAESHAAQRVAQLQRLQTRLHSVAFAEIGVRSRAVRRGSSDGAVAVAAGVGKQAHPLSRSDSANSLEATPAVASPLAASPLASAAAPAGTRPHAAAPAGDGEPSDAPTPMEAEAAVVRRSGRC